LAADPFRTTKFSRAGSLWLACIQMTAKRDCDDAQSDS
jgi:hypothetical protein